MQVIQIEKDNQRPPFRIIKDSFKEAFSQSMRINFPLSEWVLHPPIISESGRELEFLGIFENQWIFLETTLNHRYIILIFNLKMF